MSPLAKTVVKIRSLKLRLPLWGSVFLLTPAMSGQVRIAELSAAKGSHTSPVTHGIRSVRAVVYVSVSLTRVFARVEGGKAVGQGRRISEADI